jgi:hypothetical protein
VAVLHEVIEAELTKLSPKLGQAQIQKFKQAPAPPPRFVHPRPEDRAPDHVRPPGLTARYFGRTVSLDFQAWPGTACTLAIHMGATCPFKVSLVSHGVRTASARDRVSMVEAGSVHAKLEEAFLVESVQEAEASRLLADPDVEELVSGLGEFERLTLDPRFFKLARYFDSDSEISADAIFDDIQRLQQLAEAVDAWVEEASREAESAPSSS